MPPNSTHGAAPLGAPAEADAHGGAYGDGDAIEGTRAYAPAAGAVGRYLKASGGVLALVWLIYLLNVPLVLFFMEAEPWRWAASAAVVVAFLVSYLRVIVAPTDGERIAHASGQALVAAATVFVSPGINVLWIYAAGAFGLVSTPRTAIAGIAATEILVAVHGGLVWAVGGWDVGALASVYLPALVFVPVIGAVNIATTQRREANRLLRRARDEVERFAAVAERERIARDLHDLLGHTLSVVRVKAELAAKLVEVDPERAASEMREVEATAREALQLVRDAVRGYRATGLDAEVASSKIALEGAGIAFAFERTATRALNPSVERALGWVLRESVTNVLRHADAGRCRVVLADAGSSPSGDRGVQLTVEDDGRGGPELGGEPDAGGAALRAHGERHADGNAASAPQSDASLDRRFASVDGGQGLRSIAERVRALGGRAEARSGGGLGGYRVRVWIPGDVAWGSAAPSAAAADEGSVPDSGTRAAGRVASTP